MQKVPKAAADTGYVVDYVLEQLPPISATAMPNVIVETTLDKNLQRRAQEIVSDALAQTRRGIRRKPGGPRGARW